MQTGQTSAEVELIAIPHLQPREHQNPAMLEGKPRQHFDNLNKIGISPPAQGPQPPLLSLKRGRIRDLEEPSAAVT